MLPTVIVSVAALLWLTALASAQSTNSIIDPSHPAIGYPGESNDRVAQLNRKLKSGAVRLEFEEGTGYLRSLLAALDIPIESQGRVLSASDSSPRYARSSLADHQAIVEILRDTKKDLPTAFGARF